MATSGLGQHEARRKRLINRGVVIGFALTILAVAGAYWRAQRRVEEPPVPAKSLPSDVNQQLSGYTFTRSDRGRQIFTVRAARTLSLKSGGATVLEDVKVEFFGKDGGRHDVLRTRRCDYNTLSGDLSSAGLVEIELNVRSIQSPGTGQAARMPVQIETSQVSYRSKGSVVATDAPVRFRVGPATGTAKGMEYATQDGWIELKQDVAIEFQPQTKAHSQLPIHLRAASLRFDKELGRIMLGGPVETVQGKRRVDADRGAVALDAQNRIKEAMLEGNVRVTDSSAGNSLKGNAERIQAEFDPLREQLIKMTAEGSLALEARRPTGLDRLSAERVEVSFTGMPARPQKGIAKGNVVWTIQTLGSKSSGNSNARAGDSSRTGDGGRVAPQTIAAGAARRTPSATTISFAHEEFSADQAEFEFRPDGRNLANIDSVGPGRLVLVPSDPTLGKRIVTAGQFVMQFDNLGRLERLSGLSGAHIVLEPPASAPPGTFAQETSSRKLEAAFDPGSGMLQTIDQLGEFQFREGDRRAGSERAHYSNQAQVISLEGHPVLWDSYTRISAERIILDTRTEVAEGVGLVRSTHTQAAGEGSETPPVPTNVVADRVVANRASQFVRYEGHVRAWHGSDVVESSALDVYRAERRLSSGTNVVTSHLKPARETKGGKAGPPARGNSPVIIRADHLDYLDEGQKASYRGNVILQTEDTTLRANHMDVIFSRAGLAGPSEVDRAVADGRVSVVQPGRRASGEHAEYTAQDGKIVVTGGQPSLYDAEKGFITGQRLTFFIHDDSLSVDGGDKSPTVSRHRVAQ